MTLHVQPQVESTVPRGVSLEQAGAAAGPLLDYLARRLRLPGLEYQTPPVEIPNGWETHTFRFQLSPREELPEEYAGPLILRAYTSPAGLASARREYEAQRYLYPRGFGVARPLLLEEDCGPFGGPFLLREEVSGPTLVEDLRKRPWSLLRAALRMASTHLRLHTFPADDFPAPSYPFLSRRLDEIYRLILDHGLRNLLPGLDWLVAARPGPPRDPRILHLDYHPLNLVAGPDGHLVVLDWPEADVGDYHADVATTVVLLETTPFPCTTLFEHVTTPLGRLFLKRWYLRAYGWHRTLDDRKLAYYKALAALRRLACYGRWLTAGPRAAGRKPSLVRNLSPQHLASLARYFEDLTGLTVRL